MAVQYTVTVPDAVDEILKYKFADPAATVQRFIDRRAERLVHEILEKYTTLNPCSKLLSNAEKLQAVQDLALQAGGGIES